MRNSAVRATALAGTMHLSYLAGVFADEQTIARTAHVLPPSGRIPNGCCLPAERALDHMLLTLSRDVDGHLAHATCHRRRLARQRAVLGSHIYMITGYHEGFVVTLVGGRDSRPSAAVPLPQQRRGLVGPQGHLDDDLPRARWCLTLGYSVVSFFFLHNSPSALLSVLYRSSELTLWNDM